MIWVVLGVVVLAGAAYLLLKKRPVVGDIPPGVALLLKSPMILSAEQLRRVYEPEFGPVEELERIEVADAPAFRCVMRVAGREVRLSCTPAPPPELRVKFGEEVTDRRAKEALLAHEFILMAECPKWQEEVPRELFAFMTRMVGLLGDERAIAFYMFPEMATVVVTPEVLEHLKAGNIEEAYRSAMVPVQSIEADDERMVKAIVEARRRWPEFVELFASGAGQCFVKVRFEHKGKVEHMWISATSASAEGVKGRLDNEPMDIPFLKIGDEVEATVGEVSDWMVMRGEERIGAFSVGLLMGE